MFLEISFLKVGNSGLLQPSSFKGQYSATPLSDDNLECVSSMRHFQILAAHILK